MTYENNNLTHKQEVERRLKRFISEQFDTFHREHFDADGSTPGIFMVWAEILDEWAVIHLAGSISDSIQARIPTSMTQESCITGRMSKCIMDAGHLGDFYTNPFAIYVSQFIQRPICFITRSNFEKIYEWYLIDWVVTEEYLRAWCAVTYYTTYYAYRNRLPGKESDTTVFRWMPGCDFDALSTSDEVYRKTYREKMETIDDIRKLEHTEEGKRKYAAQIRAEIHRPSIEAIMQHSKYLDADFIANKCVAMMMNVTARK